MVNGTLDRQNKDIDPLFLRLALGAAITTFILIIVGAITRVSQSGMGCGTDWPLCNGQFGDFSSTAAIIEQMHRLIALPVGAFAAALLIRGWMKHRHEPRLFIPAVLGVALYFLQAFLGMITVVYKNAWFTVLLHLCNSMLLLAVFIIAWLNSRPQLAERRDSSIRLPEAVLAALLAMGVALVGAAVAGNNATKACVSYPLCYGEVWPVDQGPLQTLNMAHRLIAGGLGIFIVVMLFQSRSANATLRNALYAAFGLYILQAAIGAGVVLSPMGGWLVLAQSLHVTFAAATWSALIIVCGVVWLQQQSNKVKTSPREPLGVPSATTFS